MDVLIYVSNQKLKLATNLNDYVEGTQEFIKFNFRLPDDWNGLTVFAQFGQDGKFYNKYLDAENCVYLPHEIGAGTCTLMLYGSDHNVIATTNYLTLTINKNILVSNAASTEITESLYQQLVTRVNALASVNGQNVLDLVETDRSLQAQINQKATNQALTEEIQRAKNEEKKNSDALALKAPQSQVDALSLRLDQLANNEVVANEITEAVKRELNVYLASGQLAAMTISDGSIARSKVDSAFESTLGKADSAMQPSVYDPQNRRADIYSYAQSKADTVQNSVNEVKSEIRAAYELTDTLVYQNLKDTIQGAVALSRNYAQALLADYKAFTIKIVNDLPTVGDAQTFYLLPKTSGNGYDKYWYITDDEGIGKWDVFGASSTLVVNNLPDVGEEDVDYILDTSSGCLYYKYIEGRWRIVAGSIAYVSSTLPDESEGNAFTDYYVIDETNGAYIHYRFINGEYRVIGGNSYTKDEINGMLLEMSENIQKNAADIESSGINFSSLSQTVDKIRSDVDNLDTEGYTYYHTIEKNEDTGNYVLTLYQVKDGVEEIASQTNLPATGGGGGGTTTTTTVTLERVTPSPLIITVTDNAIIEVDFSAVDADGETVDATYTWKNGSTVLMTGAMVQGRNSFDLSGYVSVGTQKFSLTVVDEAGTTVLKTWTIQKVDIRIESSFNDRYTFPIGRSVSFTYTPYGAVNKTIHFKLDGVETTTTTSSSGTLQSYTIQPQDHGAHLLEVWATATINSVPVETSHIFRDIVWYDSEKVDGEYRAPIIGCIYRNDYYGTVNLRQYDTMQIVYNVFDPSTNYPVVKRYVDGELISTDTLNASQALWNFQSDDVGEHTLRIAVGETSVTIIVNVSELGIDVSPIVGNLEIDFNPTGITNSSANRIWSNDNYSMSVSQNFDWVNGGYKIDENGDSYFLVKAGTSIEFDYFMFPDSLTDNPSVRGGEMKIVFMTENVQDADAVWLTNVEKTTNEVDGKTQNISVGIQMGVHSGWLKTNSASDDDVDVGEGENAETIAATNTYLYMPYSEEDIIEMDINIDAIDRENQSAQAFVMAYEDGVPSKAFVYNSTDRFYQYTKQPVRIGSEYCDVRIYRLKFYSASLSTENIMRNFIADSRNSNTMLARYDRNSIYYNRETGEFTPYSGEGILDPELLAKVIPNVKVLMLDTDHFTTSKKTFVKSSLRCIHASGGELYPGDPHLDNWLFENGWHSGQGTTSDNYGNSGRNVDFLFNCDGVHKPSDKVNAEEGYISKVTIGYNTENATTESVTDWKGDSGKVALTRTSVPNNFFNLKVNIASSENVNNALLQKRYNDYLPYISPAKKRDPNAKNDMEFVPAVLFIRENNPDISTHKEFNDTEWHFYALGNIGDSKKTDYTRAYDPEDMNEFTIEISDNTKNNATFQTGVFVDENGNRHIETFTTNASGDPVSTQKPSSFVYPITEAEWNDASNMRHWCIYNEGFDGDHSFEPRYACCGDYRDGKLVNDTSGRGAAQININNEVWRAFYRWVITSTDQQFVDELDQWCVRSAVEFFYAFTHMYTMMDNRAKNTFWHFAKTGVYREVSRPVSELLHVYCEKNGEEYTPTSDTSIQSGKAYYTQYAFDLWDYDNDTALGINNNGELVFPYGKEDGDYNIDGSPSSGYVFNGATSVFWCRLRDLLSSEIRNTFNSVAAECFSATNLINQFDKFQECFPEEVWRLDIQRKYIRTFTGESIDGSIEKHDVQYLRDMMQGRKKYQRRQWIRDQEMYFGTMNLMNTVVGDNNRITFRCFTPTGSDVVVPPDYTLRLVPYTDMYLSVMFGNGGVEQVRAKGGVEYTIECPLSTMDDTQVTIYGANRIQSLNDLSACYIAANNFSMATKLRKLVVGNTTPGYNNSRLISLTLGSNKLLEELDIRNCGNLTGSIDLSQCSNLLRLYAEGSQITGVTFATNGKVRLAHLPNSINTLIMRNLNDLVDFDANLSRLETLTLQGGTLDSLDVVTNCLDTLRTLYLYDIDWTVPSSDILNRIADMFFSLVTGSAYVSGQIRNQELLTYDRKWPDLNVTYDPQQMVTQHLITYVNADDESTVLFELYVDQGSTPPDIFANGMLKNKPTLESDEQYSYEFGQYTNGEYIEGSGWDNITEGVRAPRTVVAVYTKTIRSYTINWYSRPGLKLDSVVKKYGEEAVYPNGIPTNTSQESSYVYNIFAGWDKNTGFIRSDLDVYAIWESADLPSPEKDMKDMTPAEIFAVTTSGRASDYFVDKDYTVIKWGNDFNFLQENVESRLIAEDRVLDGQTAIDTGIKLFDANERSFTIAIDFRFASTETNNTLLSCYEEDGAEGFRLRYNSGPSIQWGDKNLVVGNYASNEHYRDIIVLRHQKGSKSLFVYHAYNSTANRYNPDIQSVEVVRTRETSSEMTLVLGAIKFLADGGYDDYGKGIIHWCKIWFDDLGEANSLDLASWCHETIKYEYCGTGRYRLAGGSSMRSNGSFIANNALDGRGYWMNTTNTNAGGWDNSVMRQLLNGRIYQGMPIQWRAMNKKVRISASAGSQSTSIVVSEDNMYLASIKEVNPSETNTTYASEGDPISWFVANSYTNTVGGAMTANATRIKFKGRPIPDDAKYYFTNSDPTASSTNNVKAGDIWVHTGNSSNGFMYVTAEEIQQKAIVPTYNASNGGGWVASYWYWLRSPNVSNSTGFWYVGTSGSVGGNNANSIYAVVPCFSI